MSLNCPVASKVAKPSLLFDRPCWPDQHAVPSTRADPGVFIAQIRDSVLLLVVHIDNCTMTGSSVKLIAVYKGKLHKQYTLTDLGPVNWLLGIQIMHNWEA